MADPDIDDLKRRMNGALEVLRHEFGGLRTGRASASLLEPVTVEIYGSQMPLNQVGTISVPEPRMLSVQVWDKSAVGAVEKAIRDAGLGLNPASDGQLVRVPIPELTAERRDEMSKIAHKYAEQARVAVRHVRRDGMDQLKKMEKDGDISQDDHHIWGDEIQTLTDDMIAKIDEALATKDAEIRQV
jgi:ribosome recycling factor